MAGGINKVILIGNLGKDPEVRFTPTGQAVANFNIATSESWTDKTSGEKKDRTEWHRIVVWGKLGELCGEYLKKGRQCYVEGRLQTREWTDKEGKKKYTTEVVANTVQFLGGGAGRPAAEELHGVRDHLCRVLLFALFVGPLAGLETTLDVALPTLLEVLAAQFAELSPDDDAVPLGAFLLLVAGLVRPGLAGRDVEVRDCLPGRREADLRVLAEVTDENDLVDSACHVLLLSRTTPLRGGCVWSATSSMACRHVVRSAVVPLARRRSFRAVSFDQLISFTRRARSRCWSCSAAG